MTGRDDEIIAALESSPGDPPTSDMYARVATGVRRRRRRHIALSSASVAACMVAVLAVAPALLRGHGSAPAQPAGPAQSVAAPPVCASTLDAEPSDATAPGGSGLVPGEPSSAVLCEYDQVDQPPSLKRHAQLDSAQLAKTLAIVGELKLTNEVAKCPFQATVNVLTFGYADGSSVTLSIGCAMVWRTDEAHAMLTSPLTDEVDAILGAAPSSPPPSITAPVLVPDGGTVLELDDEQRLQIANLETGVAVLVSLRGVAGGPSLIATDPTGGWVVTYTPEAAPQWGEASSQLALVDSTGHATPFGPTYPAATPITGLAVSPDGSRVAIALMQATSGPPPSSIVVMPMPGREGAEQTWSVADNAVNEIISLSWAPDGRRLSYIAGIQTGAGIGGDPITLDTAKPGKFSTRSTWTHHSCDGVGAAWLGTSGQFAIVDDCSPNAHFQTVNATSGAGTGATIQLAGHACLDAAIHPSSNGSRSLVVWCRHVYLVANGSATSLGDHVLDAAWLSRPTARASTAGSR